MMLFKDGITTIKHDTLASAAALYNNNSAADDTTGSTSAP
jgi:hypothetical protein